MTTDSVPRHPCPWCDEPDRWPDKCTEIPGGLDRRCANLIGTMCGLGDHRRCEPSSCVVAERWHEPVREAGVRAAEESDALWAVVSTIDNSVEVIGTDDDLRHAISVLRNGKLNRAGVPLGPVGKGLVYIVRRADGGLF